MFRPLFLFVFAMLLSAGYSHAQNPLPASDTFKVRGKAVDSATHRPLDFALAVLMRPNGAMVRTTYTSADGSFAFDAPDKGPYMLSISLMGYRNYASGPISGAVADLGDIGLAQVSNTLSEVVVRHKKAVIQTKGDKIIYNASADIGNKAGSAGDVLRKAPMVTVGPDGEVKMRGSSNIKVLLNGLPSGIMAKNLKEALKMIPASTIESVEVITSPSAKYAAEGAAGVINIITKKKIRGTSGNVDLAAGNLEQSANGSLNVAAGKFNFSLSLNANSEKERNVSELSRSSFDNGARTGNLLQRMDNMQRDRGAYGDFAIEFRPDSTQKIAADISYWKGQWPSKGSLYNLYESGLGRTEYNQSSVQRGKFSSSDLSLNYQKKFRRTSQELQLIAQYSRATDESDYLTDQYYLSGQHYFRERGPNKGRSTDVNLQADYSHPLSRSGRQLLETGASYLRNSSASSYKVFSNQGNPGGPEAEDPLRSDQMSYHQNVLAAYLGLKFETGNNWILRPGIRYENTRLGASFNGPSPAFRATFNNFVPSMLVSKKLNDMHELKFTYTERIRRPAIWDLNPYVNASDPRNLSYGNPRLRPELTRLLEAGHTYSGQSGMVLNSILYFGANGNAIEQLATVDAQGISRTVPQNIASNRRLGANINAYAQLNEAWTLGAGAELFHVWFRSPALNIRNDASFFSLNLNSSYTMPAGYSAQVSADYSNGFVTLQGRNSSNYNYRFSLRKEFMGKKASLTLGINNPFQRNFLQKSFASAPTFQSNTLNRYYNRSFTLSFSWQFGSLRPAERPKKEQPAKGRPRGSGAKENTGTKEE